MTHVVAAMRRRRFIFLCVADSLIWVASFAVFALARFLVTGVTAREAVAAVPWHHVALLGLAAATLHVGLGMSVRLHQGRSSIGSVEEMLSLGLVAACVGSTATAANLVAGRYIPGTVPMVGAFVALVVMAWYRAAYRASREQYFRFTRRGFEAGSRQRVIVMGAGDAGMQLVKAMMSDPGGNWLPVALLDDDPSRRHRRARGVRVLGARDDVADVAAALDATHYVIAIPSASAETVRTLSQPALDTGLEVKVLPSAGELLRPGQVGIADIRDIEVTDLLGRHQIDTDIDSIAGYLTGRRVLVTGAGGSIGSELCRQIAKFHPGELIMLDRDESALHAVQLSIYGKAMLDSDDVVLGDIRDSLFIDALFETRKPEVVFHAAALKHLPMLEQYPGEAIKTNVWGTLSILEAARAHRVEKFVNVSTDKAANPCSVLGYSKRLAEGLTASVAQTAEGTFLSVRFGNVLGSRGSVLTAFAAQIANGGPVTVTDPDVTRYFMTVQEAVQLVIQAAAIGRDGEALVLDMGQPVSIDAVARQLIELSGKEIEIVYTGLREGEKMHEELWGDGEPDLRPVHRLVSHTPVPAYASFAARELDPWAPASAVRGSLGEAAACMAAEQVPVQRESIEVRVEERALS
jgi:FlaA1/EpsC-like NDP-sugar epimerase